MPLANLRDKTAALPIQTYTMEEFGGLNLRDGADMQPGDLLQATNVDLSGTRARARFGTLIMPTPPPVALDYFYHSVALGFIYGVNDAGSKVYRTTNPFGAWTDVSAGAPSLVGGSDMVEFNGVLVFVSAAGVYTFDGTSVWTLRSAAVTGTSIVAWQNKLWVVGNGTSIMYWSKAGDYATWDTANDFNYVREGAGDRPLIGLHVTQEMDSIGRPSLLPFKTNSLHRVNSPTTGSYTTLSVDAAPIHKRAIVSNGNMTAFIAGSGIYVTNGASTPQLVSDKIRGLFTLAGVGNPSGIQPQPVYHRGRFIFSFPGYNTYSGAVHQGSGGVVHVEWEPLSGRFSVDQWPCFSSGASQGAVNAWLSIKTGSLVNALYGSDQLGNIFLPFTASQATDNGTQSYATIQTPYLQLAGGKRFRIHRLRLSAVFGNLSVGAPFTLRVRRDGSSTDSITRVLSSGQTSPPTLQTYDFHRLGDCRSVSFVLEFPVAQGVTLGSGYAPYSLATQAQANEINRLLVEYTPTGRN